MRRHWRDYLSVHDLPEMDEREIEEQGALIEADIQRNRESWVRVKERASIMRYGDDPDGDNQRMARERGEDVTHWSYVHPANRDDGVERQKW
tara:strand:+ start:1050 stop:1325 length:276 start_codon:yes stop_codon:yes gene_type:complete